MINMKVRIYLPFCCLEKAMLSQSGSCPLELRTSGIMRELAAKSPLSRVRNLNQSLTADISSRQNTGVTSCW